MLNLTGIEIKLRQNKRFRKASCDERFFNGSQDTLRPLNRQNTRNTQWLGKFKRNIIQYL